MQPLPGILSHPALQAGRSLFRHAPPRRFAAPEPARHLFLWRLLSAPEGSKLSALWPARACEILIPDSSGSTPRFPSGLAPQPLQTLQTGKRDTRPELLPAL